MKLKQYRLYFRYRTVTNDLNDLFEVVQSESLKLAKLGGKRLAEERAPAYGGKYWFMGVESWNAIPAHTT